MSEKIIRAINRMDPENDNHWTVDGLAKLDTVRFYAGEAVTREKLDEIAPGFNRESLKAYRGQTAESRPPTQGAGPFPGSPPANETYKEAIERKFGDVNKPDMGVDAKVADPTNPQPIESGLQSPVDADGNRSGIEIAIPEKSPETRDMPISPVDADGMRTGFEAPLPPRNMGAALIGQKQEEPADADGPTESPVDAEGNRTGIGPRTAITAEPKEKVEPETKTTPESQAREAEIKTLAAEIDNARKTVDEFQRIYVKAREDLKQAQLHHDGLTHQLNAIRPKDDNQRTIQTYLEKQKQVMLGRAATAQMVQESGVNLKELNRKMSPAPIDQALKTRPRQNP